MGKASGVGEKMSADPERAGPYFANNVSRHDLVAGLVDQVRRLFFVFANRSRPTPPPVVVFSRGVGRRRPREQRVVGVRMP